MLTTVHLQLNYYTLAFWVSTNSATQTKNIDCRNPFRFVASGVYGPALLTIFRVLRTSFLQFLSLMKCKELFKLPVVLRFYGRLSSAVANLIECLRVRP